MPNMPNAPLVYTLGVVRFPLIPAIDSYKNELIAAFRGTYPQFDEIALNFVRANIAVGPDAKQTIDSREMKLFQFASPDRAWALILGEGHFGLHTAQYVDHRDFVDRFKDGLRMLLGVNRLGLEWIEAIGFRYVDLVKPRPDEQLSAYLHPWVLPPLPELKEKMEIKQGMYIAVYKTTHGDLRFQSLRNPPMTLPPDLYTPMVQKNNWIPPLPEGDFALMDIDHGCHFDPLQRIDIEGVCSKLLDLRSSSRDLFDQTGTEHALKVWKGEA